MKSASNRVNNQSTPSATHTTKQSTPPAKRQSDVAQLQGLVGNQQVLRMLEHESNLQRVLDPDVVSKLEAHIGAKSKQRDLLTQDKAGQGMAKALVNEGMESLTTGKEGNEAEKQGVSQAITRLVNFTRFDDSAGISVLKDAQNGGLSDAQKWNAIVVNSEFMDYIQPGMTINKIVPEWTINTILEQGKMNAQFGNTVMGSVAHEMNYEGGLTGEQSVSNFGLDYGGYSDKKGSKEVKLNNSQEVSDFSKGGGLSPYTKQLANKKGQSDKIQGVQNVFYVKLDLPASAIPHVKVPIHSNIIDFAKTKQAEMTAALQDGTALAQMAEAMGGSVDEVRKSLEKKLELVTKFLANAHFSNNMAVSRNLAGDKNAQDPLTNLGITKPGSRLTNQFGTINQEYHLGVPVTLAPGSGLYLKDKTGVDKLVGSLELVGNNSEWVDLKTVLIKKAMHENKVFMQS